MNALGVMYYAYAMFQDGKGTTICVSVTETKKEAGEPIARALAAAKRRGCGVRFKITFG